MSAHRILTDLFKARFRGDDPGNAGTIVRRRWFELIAIVTAGAETRILAAPEKEGDVCVLEMQTYVGNCVVTVTGGFDELGSTTFTLSDPGQFGVFLSINDSGSIVWRLVSSHAFANLSSLLASAAEINRTAQNSTRPVVATTTLAVTQALHDGKTILIDSGTGFPCNLPAMTGSGARYRFAVKTPASSGSHTIVATAAHLFGGVLQNNDTVAAGLAGVSQATNVSGSTTITLNGGTTGGRKGDWIEIEDMAAGIGFVRGMLNASGTEATPFS